MEFSERSRAKVDRIEALLNEIEEITHAHMIPMEKMDIVKQDVKEGFELCNALMSCTDGHIVCCDVEAIQHLINLRKRLKKAKTDLEAPWNNPELIEAESKRLKWLQDHGFDLSNPNVIFGTIGPGFGAP